MAHVLAARRDRRWIGLVVTLVLVAAGGGLVHWMGNPERSEGTAPSARAQEIHTRFDQGVAMLHAKQYEHAVTALHRVLELAPQMPEAHVNMGFALLGLKRAQAARDFFEAASQLNPMQANAYYGSAMAFEALGDLPAAVGAMRTYLHLARQEDERHLAKARAALWEWEAQVTAQRAAGNPAPKRATPGK